MREAQSVKPRSEQLPKYIKILLELEIKLFIFHHLQSNSAVQTRKILRGTASIQVQLVPEVWAKIPVMYGISMLAEYPCLGT